MVVLMGIVAVTALEVSVELSDIHNVEIGEYVDILFRKHSVSGVLYYARYKIESEPLEECRMGRLAMIKVLDRVEVDWNNPDFCLRRSAHQFKEAGEVLLPVYDNVDGVPTTFSLLIFHDGNHLDQRTSFIWEGGALYGIRVHLKEKEA